MKNTIQIFTFCKCNTHLWSGWLMLSERRECSLHSLLTLTSYPIHTTVYFLTSKTASAWNCNHLHLLLRLRMQNSSNFWWHVTKAVTSCLRSLLFCDVMQCWLVTQYHSTLCNIPVEQIPHLYCGRSVKSCNCIFCILYVVKYIGDTNTHVHNMWICKHVTAEFWECDHCHWAS